MSNTIKSLLVIILFVACTITTKLYWLIPVYFLGCIIPISYNLGKNQKPVLMLTNLIFYVPMSVFLYDKSISLSHYAMSCVMVNGSVCNYAYLPSTASWLLFVITVSTSAVLTFKAISETVTNKYA